MNIVLVIVVFALLLSVVALVGISIVELRPFGRHLGHHHTRKEGAHV